MKALRIDHLSKTYKNGARALNGVDLTVDEGDFFALLGPNGAGKSTLIGVVSSLIRRSTGTVSIFGHDIERSPNSAKRLVGLVPQEINLNLFDRAIDIVVQQAGYYGIPRARATDRAEEILAALGLWDKRHAVSRSLSGGMKRRLMIARALAHNPKLLILDEPTAGVDIEIRKSVWEFLESINRSGTTIILTTHYLEEAENLCRNIAIINHGRIVEDSSMPDLLRRLHRDSYVLYLAEPLAQAPELGDAVSCELADSKTLTVDVPESLGLSAVFERLAALGVTVKSLRNKANRLEQLFLNLVDQDSEAA